MGRKNVRLYRSNTTVIGKEKNPNHKLVPDRGSNPVYRIQIPALYHVAINADRIQIPALYHVAIKAGVYSDVVECRNLNTADRVRSPAGEKYDLDFFSFRITFGGQCGGGSLGA